MNPNKQKPISAVLYRLIGLTVLVGGIFAFGWMRSAENDRSGDSAVAHGSSPALPWRSDAATIQGANAAITLTKGAKAVPLKGTFSPANESLLMEQLTREGYIYLSSYRLNPDGSAAIMAMQAQRPVQMMLTIALDKEGNATVHSGASRHPAMQ